MQSCGRRTIARSVRLPYVEIFTSLRGRPATLSSASASETRQTIALFRSTERDLLTRVCEQSIRNESRRRARTAEASSCGRLCVACRSRIGRLTPSHCVQCVVAIHLRVDDCVKFRSPVARFRSQSGRDYRECN